MKFPLCIEKNLSEIIKIYKPHKKGLIINFSNYLQISLPKIQWSKVIHQQTLHQYTYMLPTQKHYKFIKKLAVDGSTYSNGRGVDHARGRPLHWYSGKREFHVYLVLSNFSNFTPNTWYTKYTFFMCFSKIRRKEKRVFGVEQSLPIKLRVIGVFGKSKSCLGLGYTEACGTIRCHLKNFWCFLLEHFPSFFSVSQ